MNARPTYAPSGRANLADLWPYALVLFGVAALVALAHAALTGHDAYAVGYVWLAGGALTTWLARKLVRDSHCRNGPLAAALLGAAGLVVFVGSYHADQCLRWGVGWQRLDRLPGFVTFRMETDGWWAHDARMPLVWPLEADPRVVPHHPPRVRPNVHWLALLAEFAAVVVWPILAAWAFARRPYSETLGAWYREEGVHLTPESAADLRIALTDGQFALWADLGLEKTQPQADHVRMWVWVCPRPADRPEVEPEVYLTLGKAKPVLLTPEEVAALVETFPSLNDWATVPVELRLASLAQTPPPWNPALATFSRVPPPHAGRCKDAGVIWRGRVMMVAVAFAPLAALFAAAGLAIPLCRALESVGVESTPYLVAYFLACGAASLVVLVRYHNPNEDLTLKFLMRYYHRAMLGEARQRDDALFDVDRPGVVYAEMLPRRLWHDMANPPEGVRLDEAALLLIDTDARRILFEGDRYRWSIPFAAVRKYEVEVITVNPEFHAVVLSFDTAEGLKELPLVPTTGLPGANRFERAGEFYRQLDEAVGPTLNGTPRPSPTPAAAG